MLLSLSSAADTEQRSDVAKLGHIIGRHAHHFLEQDSINLGCHGPPFLPPKVAGEFGLPMFERGPGAAEIVASWNTKVRRLARFHLQIPPPYERPNISAAAIVAEFRANSGRATCASRLSPVFKRMPCIEFRIVAPDVFAIKRGKRCDM